MNNIWNSFECDCVARDFSYNEYLALHTQTEQKHATVSREGYYRLGTFFYLEMLNDETSNI